MQDVLIFVLKNIVTHPDDVKIKETDEQGTTNYIVSVHPDDVGRIIGKEGKVIKAIRTIMRVIAIQKGIHVRVSVVSEADGSVTGTGEVVSSDQSESAQAELEAATPIEPANPDSLNVEV